MASHTVALRRMAGLERKSHIRSGERESHIRSGEMESLTRIGEKEDPDASG